MKIKALITSLDWSGEAGRPALIQLLVVDVLPLVVGDAGQKRFSDAKKAARKAFDDDTTVTLDLTTADTQAEGDGE